MIRRIFQKFIIFQKNNITNLSKNKTTINLQKNKTTINLQKNKTTINLQKIKLIKRRGG
jgi:hypothetical protein